jgi:hypothetical protein
VIFINKVTKYARRVGLPLVIGLLGVGGLAAQQPATPPANAAPQQPNAAPANAPPQQPNAAPANAPPLGAYLKILVLIGEDAVNYVRSPMPSDLVVEVRDQNDRPMEGATVSFQMPLMGASGSFDGGVRNKDFVTNVQGQATASFMPNMESGRYMVQVKAVLGGLSGMTTITQRNTMGNESAGGKSWIGRHKLLVIIAVAVVAGGVTAGILATRGGSKSGSGGGNTVTITPGVPTIGGSQ